MKEKEKKKIFGTKIENKFKFIYSFIHVNSEEVKICLSKNVAYLYHFYLVLFFRLLQEKKKLQKKKKYKIQNNYYTKTRKSVDRIISLSLDLKKVQYKFKPVSVYQKIIFLISTILGMAFCTRTKTIFVIREKIILKTY